MQGKVYAFLPHGTQFLSPAVISLPNAGGSDVTGLRAENGGSWATVGRAQVSGTNVEMSTTTLSFYAVGSAAQTPDAGATCSGRGPDNSAPTGKLSAMTGNYIGSSGTPNVDLTTLVDGYADNSHGDIFMITMTPYAKACGTFMNGVNRIGQPMFVVAIPQHEPTTGTYSGSGFTATSSGFPAETQEGACVGAAPGGGPGGADDSLKITEIDASHVAGSFTYKAPGNREVLSGSFDVPRCTPAPNLEPPGCCVK